MRTGEGRTIDHPLGFSFSGPDSVLFRRGEGKKRRSGEKRECKSKVWNSEKRNRVNLLFRLLDVAVSQ